MSRRSGNSFLSNMGGASDFRAARSSTSRKSRDDYLKAGILNDIANITSFIPGVGNVVSTTASMASTVESAHAQGLTLTKTQIWEMIGGAVAGLGLARGGFAAKRMMSVPLEKVASERQSVTVAPIIERESIASAPITERLSTDANLSFKDLMIRNEGYVTGMRQAEGRIYDKYIFNVIHELHDIPQNEFDLEIDHNNVITINFSFGTETFDKYLAALKSKGYSYYKHKGVTTISMDVDTSEYRNFLTLSNRHPSLLDFRRKIRYLSDKYHIADKKYYIADKMGSKVELKDSETFAKVMNLQTDPQLAELYYNALNSEEGRRIMSMSYEEQFQLLNPDVEL